MNPLIEECNNLLKGNGFEYAFCGGHALDIHLGYVTRQHGDVDLSAYWADRNTIIKSMYSQDWKQSGATDELPAKFVLCTKPKEAAEYRSLCE